jgi:hypothetical protein
MSNSYSSYPPPVVDEHGHYPWEQPAASGSSGIVFVVCCSCSLHLPASVGPRSSTTNKWVESIYFLRVHTGYGYPPSDGINWNVDASSLDFAATGYTKPAQRRIECTICKRIGHDYKNCPNKKAKGDVSDTIYISGLPSSINDRDLVAFFGSIGIVAKDKKTGGDKVKIYTDAGGVPKGDALLSYEDSNSAPAAVSWFNGTLCVCVNVCECV